MADYNAIFRKWNEQVSENSGFYVPCKFGYDIFTPLALHATIGVAENGGDFYQKIVCDSRTWESPWMERMTESDIKEDAYTIGTEANFDAVAGTFKRYDLDLQLSISKTITGIEKSTVPYDFAGFVVRDLTRVLANKMEDEFIKEIINNGAKGDGTRKDHEFDANMVVKDDSDVVDYYQTIGRIVRTCTEQGWAESDIVVYVSPAVAEAMMSKGMLMGNGAQSSAAFDFMRHKNQVGVIQGVPVIRVPRLAKWESLETGIAVNMLVCNKSQIFKLEYLRVPLQLTPVTERHLDPTDRYVKALSWLRWALKVENAAFFIKAEDGK